jgi:putative effector of murein hydrolase LrgA (UPF0299 family)
MIECTVADAYLAPVITLFFVPAGVGLIMLAGSTAPDSWKERAIMVFVGLFFQSLGYLTAYGHIISCYA